MNAEAHIPAGEPAKIYLMRNEFGLYKIGISIDPEARRAQVECSSGVPTTLLELFDSLDAYQEEQAIHARLKESRRCGEWFAFDNDQEARQLMQSSLAALRASNAPQQTTTTAAPIELNPTQYRVGLGDVQQALAAVGFTVSSYRGEVYAAHQQMLLSAAEALKVSTTVVHSELTKGGFYKPDRVTIKHYIEAIALLNPEFNPLDRDPENPLFKQWLSKCCEQAPAYSASCAALFDDWLSHALASNAAAGSVKSFAQAMRKLGFEPYRTTTERGFKGVRVRGMGANAQGDELKQHLFKAIADGRFAQGEELTVTQALARIGGGTSRAQLWEGARALKASGLSHRILKGRTVYKF